MLFWNPAYFSVEKRQGYCRADRQQSRFRRSVSRGPYVSTQVMKDLKPIIAALPAGYKIEMGGSIEEAGKANVALAAIFPLMFILMMVVIIFQVRSLSAMFIVLLTAPLLWSVSRRPC